MNNAFVKVKSRNKWSCLCMKGKRISLGIVILNSAPHLYGNCLGCMLKMNISKRIKTKRRDMEKEKGWFFVPVWSIVEAANHLGEKKVGGVSLGCLDEFPC